MSFDAATASTGRILTEKETDAAALRQAKCAGARIGYTGSAVNNVLREYGYRVRTRRGGKNSVAKAPEPAPNLVPKSKRPALQFTSGERYGDLVFERVVNAQARLYLFRHACGWRETFTDFQWRERKAT